MKQHLMGRARAARLHAYAPYSKFQVGAALLAENGDVFLGCNVENASFGLTNCAERVALGSAVAAGHRRFLAVAIAGPESMTLPPCGACRQVLVEFAPDLCVLLSTPEGGVKESRARDLLPGAFSAADLETR